LCLLSSFLPRDKLSLELNGGRHGQGIWQRCDPFTNLMMDECVEMATSGQQNQYWNGGNSIITINGGMRK
uniref:Sm domain-containing protein n=1 Tax=Equus asinus TaxID=9793 RepID=A0A9L0JEH4_EQUAS